MAQTPWGGGARHGGPVGGSVSRTVTELQIDGAALLRIVKHAEDNLPGQSAGGLLGLDMPRGESQGSVMQVTYAFAMPRARDAYGDGMMDDDGDEDRIGNEREFARQTMKLLKDVNVDNNLVGWYRTMQLGHFSEGGMRIDASGARSQRTLFDIPPALMEDLSDSSVVLLYDPVQTAMGTLTIKAFRHVRGSAARDDPEQVLSFKDLFEEIPVVIRNPGVVSAFLYDLQFDAKSKSNFSKLDLSSGPYLTKNVELLAEEVDRMSMQLERTKRFYTMGGRPPRDNRGWNRRRDEDDGEPSRVDTVVTATQIGAYCSQISSFSRSGFSKLFLMGSLHKEGGAAASSSSSSS